MIYREKSDIFSLRLRVLLTLFIKKLYLRNKNSARFLTSEEGHLHKDKISFHSLMLGGVNAFIP